MMILMIGMTVTGFRPLIGVNFCKPFSNENDSPDLSIGFRPLIGVNFCKRSAGVDSSGEFGVGFPSPYRG